MDYEALEALFRERDWRWIIDGTLVHPTVNDFQRVVDSARKTLYDEPVGSTLFVGRLGIQKGDDEHTDIYVLFGEIHD